MRSSSPPRAPKRSRSMTPPSLRMQAGKATRSRTRDQAAILSKLDAKDARPGEAMEQVLYAHLRHAAARSSPVLSRCLSAIMARPLRN
jgi:hypothetical protein